MLLFGILLNYFIKSIKLLYNIIEVNINCFIIYHLHYKKKLKITEFIYHFFSFLLFSKLIFLINFLFNYIIIFIIDYLHYKN